MNKIDSIICFDDPEDMFRFKPEYITADQKNCSERIQRAPLDISMEEIRHVLSLISECDDFYRQPSSKFRTYPGFIARYGISLITSTQSILSSRHYLFHLVNVQFFVVILVRFLRSALYGYICPLYLFGILIPLHWHADTSAALAASHS